MTLEPIETPSLAGQVQFAETLAGSNLLPKQYQRQPANVLLAMQLGNALGIPPIQAITGIHVVEGKPTASADLIASLVRRAGHKLRVSETQTQGGPSVTVQLIRADDPDFTFEVTWDMAKARAAGLAGKNVWKQYPGQMLRSRAITEVCRQGASDALYGVIYTAEELDQDAPVAGSVQVSQVDERDNSHGPANAEAIMAAAEEPKPEPQRARDWAGEIEDAPDLEALRAIFEDGLPREFWAAMTARKKQLEATQPPLEGELVTEGAEQ